MNVGKRANVLQHGITRSTERFNVSHFNFKKKSGKGNKKSKRGNFKMFFEENEITDCNYIILVK